MLEKKLLIPETFSADPSVHVFNGKLYIYPSHDRDVELESNDNGDQYMMEDYHVYEMENTEIMPKDCGMIFILKMYLGQKSSFGHQIVPKKTENTTFTFRHATSRVSSALALQ